MNEIVGFLKIDKRPLIITTEKNTQPNKVLRKYSNAHSTYVHAYKSSVKYNAPSDLFKVA